MLSETHAAAAKALERFLGHQSGHAQNIAAQLPQDVAEAIAGHALEHSTARDAIKDELARLYDLRRDGHARDAAAEMAHQQQVLAARIVIERETGATPDQSLAATKILTEDELAELAGFQVEPNCHEHVVGIIERSARRAANAAPQEAPAATDEQQLIEAAARAGVHEEVEGAAPARDDK